VRERTRSFGRRPAFLRVESRFLGRAENGHPIGETAQRGMLDYSVEGSEGLFESDAFQRGYRFPVLKSSKHSLIEFSISDESVLCKEGKPVGVTGG
jgi:hypothetical protein